MKAYRYDKITGESKGTREKQIDPLETKKANRNIYLLPANCTDKKPPEVAEGKVACWDGLEWKIKIDNRNKVYYDIVTKDQVRITEVSTRPTKNLTELSPTNIFDEWDGSKWKLNQVKLDEHIAENLKNNIISLQMRIDAGEKNDLDMSKEITELNNLKP